MNNAAKSLMEAQNNYEQWFNCSVCLCPKTRMVFGLCQHKVCEDCLYDEENCIRPALKFCPICQYTTFPLQRPYLPQDNVEMMRCLGVIKCPNPGCGVELWNWELESHLKNCENKDKVKQTVCTPTYKNSSSKKVKQKRLASWHRTRRLRSDRLV
ncbi:TNF receptor-associated factor 6-like [Gigantopelta aegis]|uniref:TNF receptor-associated factor 6-like n=1 Tax=Gigantopelta aegis TaxID=1735272 RepID=UPI001B88B383|nr:TNF receptor-associated factor 6-like [Gigantopelta aegis]